MAPEGSWTFGEAVEAQDDLVLGEWLHEQIVRCAGVDDDPVGIALVRPVQERLNAARGPLPPLEVVILFEADLAAFIGPGRYLYLTRGLLHRAWWSEAVAMVVAHEMAHHDLGHVHVFQAQLHWLRVIPGSLVLPFFRHASQRWLNGPEHEAAADQLGLDLCLEAGFDGHRCLEFFDVLESYALDQGDVEAALGQEAVAAPLPGGLGHWLRSGQEWLQQRLRGYPSLRDRKEALVEQLNASRGC